MDPPKFDWKRVLKNTLTYGLALEVIFIGTGYYLYKEYKTNQGKIDLIRIFFACKKVYSFFSFVYRIQRANGGGISSHDRSILCNI